MRAHRHPNARHVAQIQAALAYQDVDTIHTVKDQIRSGEAVLFSTDQSTFTLKPCDDTIRIAQYAGVMADIPDMLRTATRIAQEVGVGKLSVRGRKGWQRVLAPYGFRPDGDALMLTI